MPRITSLTNQKGGVGKTTSAHALILGLNSKGKKVLAIDLDPQCNLSATFEITMQNPNGAYELMKNKETDVLSKTDYCDLICGNLSLVGSDGEIVQIGKEYILSKLLKEICSKNDYDYIVIDTPPNLGILTTNALTASDDVIIPLGTDMYSLHGFTQLHQTIQDISEYCNANLKIDGLLITKYNKQINFNKFMFDQVCTQAKLMDTKVFNTKIRESISIKECQALQSNIFDNPSNASSDYLSFVNEYLGEN